jgi:hypothetical protein
MKTFISDHGCELHLAALRNPAFSTAESVREQHGKEFGGGCVRWRKRPFRWTELS